MAKFRPSTPGPVVYICRDRAGDILYIGKATRWANRRYDHERSKPWWQDVASIDFIGCTPDSLGPLEEWLIQECDPPYNIQYTPRFAAWHQSVVDARVLANGR